MKTKTAELSIETKKEVSKMIIELLNKEECVITDENINFSSDESTLVIDMIIECNEIKNKKSKAAVFYNKISNKDYLQRLEKIKIFDNTDLKELALKYDNQELYKLL
jgi:hypothetical protein